MCRVRVAARRFGLTIEGVSSQHFIVKGKSCDTVWLTMLDGARLALNHLVGRSLNPLNFGSRYPGAKPFESRPAHAHDRYRIQRRR